MVVVGRGVRVVVMVMRVVVVMVVGGGGDVVVVVVRGRQGRGQAAVVLGVRRVVQPAVPAADVLRVTDGQLLRLVPRELDRLAHLVGESDTRDRLVLGVYICEIIHVLQKIYTRKNRWTLKKKTF